MPSFKVRPVYLSPEHAKQAERFQGFPYDPAQDAAMKSLAKFKQWEHRQLTARDSAPSPQNTSRKR